MGPPTFDRRRERKGATEERVEDVPPSSTVTVAGAAAAEAGPRRFVDEAGRVFLWQAEIGRGVLTSVGAAEAEDKTANTHRAAMDYERFALKTVLPLWVGHPLAEARIARERELSAELHAGAGGPARQLSCIEILGGGRQALPDGRSRPFHLSPLYEGVTVAERLRAVESGGRVLEPSLVLDWADDLLAGLGALHALGWVHRDVKPQNVFVIDALGEAPGGAPGRAPRAILIDYGLAVRTSAPRYDGDEPFGTPAYVAPEVVAGAPLDGRADLYSLGLILFELLSGRRPFPRRDPIALIEAHLSESPPPLRGLCPSISVELERVVAATLRKAPGDRPASAAELARVLRQTPEGRLPR